MTTPNIVGRPVTRGGITFHVDATVISRGKQAGDRRYVVDVPADTDLQVLIDFLSPEVVKDALLSVIRRASLDAHAACEVTTKDSNGVESTTFREDEYETNFSAALEGGSAESEKALNETLKATFEEHVKVSKKICDAYSASFGGGAPADPQVINELAAELARLANKLESVKAQLASIAAAKEARKQANLAKTK